MQNIMAAVLFAVLPLVAFSAAPEPADNLPEESTKEQVDESINLDARIQILRDEFDAIPGKTGILAEKNLYSLVSEELIIRDFFQDRKGGFFLDVGCAWAVDYSNTYYLEKHLGWTGIGVDALIDYAEEWATVRPTSKFRNYLVTDVSGGEGTFFKSDSLGLSSTNESMASGVYFGYDNKPVEVSVPMITLTDLLDQEGVTKIDLLSMDIEGHEPKAFAGFNIERFAPELLVIEGKNRRVEKYLARHGYVLIERYAGLDQVNRYYERKQMETETATTTATTTKTEQDTGAETATPPG